MKSDDEEYRAHVAAVVATAPPLSANQIAVLRDIMRRNPRQPPEEDD